MKKIIAMGISIGGTVIGVFSTLSTPLLTFADSCGASSSSFSNPTSFCNVQDFIAAVLKGIVEISLPILVLFIVYAGFKFIAARGKPAALQEAKYNFLYVIIGATLILGAWVLATLIGATVNQVLTGGQS